MYDTAFLGSDELAIVRFMDVHPAFKRAMFGAVVEAALECLPTLTQ